MNTKKYDLTHGGILQKLFLVAAPLIGTQVLQMAYNLTDLIWLGRLSPEAVASAASAGMYMWLSIAFLLTGRMGAEIGVSQSMGRSDPEAAKSFAQTALFLAVLSGVAYALFAHFFRHQLIGIFALQEAHVAYDGAIYLGIVAFGMPATFFSGAVTGIFNGVGNSRLPFLTNGFGLILNIILTPIMIFGLDMGIHGAAWSTVIAQYSVLVLTFLAVRFLPLRPFPDLRFFVWPDFRRVLRIFRWTVPITVESALFTTLSMLVGRIVASFGADMLAIQRVGVQVESFSWLIAMGFASALTAYMGQNYGRGCWTRIHRGMRLSMYTMIVWGLITTAIPWVFGRQLFSLFLPEEALLQEGVRFLRILSISQLFICLEFWAAGTFRGLGKTLPPSVSSITGNSIRLLLCYVLSQTSLGLTGLWWGFALGVSIRGIILITWFLIYSRRLPREDVPVVAEKAG